MPEILDQIDPKGELAEQLESARNNFLTLTKQTLRAGAYLISNTKVETAQVVTSATYAKVTALEGSFNSAGGLVLFAGGISISLSGPQTASIVLLIDGEEKQFIPCSVGAAGVWTSSAPLNFYVALNEGRHTWQIKAKTDNFGGNTVTVGSATLISNLSILEFLRG